MSNTMKFEVSNMKCGGCVANVKKALEGAAGIDSVEVDLEKAEATVTGDADAGIIAKIITDAGYPAQVKG
ncbi:MAG: copper-binding protein [Gammaproteobacteria bacterium]|nr:MAG: copper-binding protein [Gammaproteobacteria bacterium]